MGTNHTTPEMIGLRSLRRISWAAVLHAWQRQEAAQPTWIRHYHKKGYRSWREWRNTGFRPLHPERRHWYLFEIVDPSQSIPQWYGGPFGGWRKRYYRGRKSISFASLATNPKIRRHRKIGGILNRFPRQSLMIGATVGQRVYVLEGMHRACALALAAQRGKPVRVRITIALTRLRTPLPDLSHPPAKRLDVKNKSRYHDSIKEVVR